MSPAINSRNPFLGLRRRTDTHFLATAACAAIALLASCRAGDAPPGSSLADASDSAGAATLADGASTADLAFPVETAPPDTVHMRVAWEVAPGRHPAADSLGVVSGVTLDSAGYVYATDQLNAKIWVFDSRGRLWGSIGRKGEGPGEFDMPTGPAIGPDGRLYVRDIERVSVFGRDPGTGLLSSFETSFPGPLYSDYLSMRGTRFEASGALFYPGQAWRTGQGARPWVVRFVDGAMADTIFVPEYANEPEPTAWVRLEGRGGRMLPGLNHVPFAPLPVWDVTPEGTVISGDGTSYVLVETDRDGRVLARFGRNVPLDPIPAAERRDSIAALKARLDSIPVGLDRVGGMPEAVRKLDVPRRYPAYMAVYVTNDGGVWVRRWPIGGGNRTIFDVFARTGEFRRTVVLPHSIMVEPTPYLSGDVVVGVARDPVTDESIILRFEKDASG